MDDGMFNPREQVLRQVRRIQQSISIADNVRRNAHEFVQALLRPHKGVVRYVLGLPTCNSIGMLGGLWAVKPRW